MGAGEFPEGQHDPVRGSDADCRGTADAEHTDRLPHLFGRIAAVGGDAERELRLVEQHEMPVDLSLPLKRRDGHVRDLVAGDDRRPLVIRMGGGRVIADTMPQSAATRCQLTKAARYGRSKVSATARCVASPR